MRGGLGGRGAYGVPLVPAVDDEKTVEHQASASPTETSGHKEPFDPDLDDVFLVKDLLKLAGNIPDEIALMILDSADYWACSSTTVDYTTLPGERLVLRGSYKENQFLVRSEPLGMTSWSPNDEEAWRQQAIPQKLQGELPREKLYSYVDERIESIMENPCRKIVFKIQSNDQGWGGNRDDKGSFMGSWTWFDAGLERFEGGSKSQAETGSSNDDPDVPVSALRPIWPPVVKEHSEPMRYDHELHPTADHKIQGNRTAHPETQNHVVEWRYTDDIYPDSSEADELEAAGRGRATGNGEFVRNLRLGDVVTIWGRARFGSWENRIKKVELKVYWKAV
jgi:hypothetical protein